MPAPAFEFTSRATPIVQMGRSSRLDSGNRWQTGLWGTGLWGVRDWEVAWTDLTCEIHEITTDTGRGGATDRFRPGTANIVASNLNQVSELIFPPVPDTGDGFEFVPQPPITNEEDLQAPNATTVISNGWSFTDDFETAPPRWRFPAAFATSGTYPTVPFVYGDGWIEPEAYYDASVNWQAHSVAQWTGPYQYPLLVDCQLEVDDLDWPVAPSAGSPQLVVEMYAFGNTSNQACNCARVTLTPNFAGSNTASVDLFEMGADGSRVAGITTPTTISSGLGTNGHFGPLTFRMWFDPFSDAAMAGVNDLGTSVLSFTDWATGNRLGFAVHWVEGTVAGDSPGPPRVTYYSGPASLGVPAFTDDFSRPTGSGWVERSWGPLIMEDGALRPPLEFNGQGYNGTGSAQWVSDFDGDQTIELDLTGMSRPDIVGGDGPNLEMYLKGNRTDAAAVVAIIDYTPGWGSGESEIYWKLVQYGPNEEWVYGGDVDGETFGMINLGATDGMYPEPATWRLEADTAGDVRLYYQHSLVSAVEFPDIPTGGRVGVYLNWETHHPDIGNRRPGVARIERITAGLREPLGTEELGTWVRIGVDHATLGERWFFRGFVDAVVPTYHPEHQDAVRIECIDSLGEAGRVFVDGDQLSHRFNSAPGRIRQILHRAHWPRRLQTIRDDSTQMSRPAPGKAVDLLTHVAESCGGAVYGDPDTGDVVFKGQDWQGVSASEEPEAFITNYHPDVDDGVPRVCPVGWERSSRRSDMYTRVRYQTETSETFDGHPIIKEWREPNAERIYGVELYERTLLCITGERLNELAIRQLRLRHPNQFPRIEAVLLDAATEEAALDLMTTATFTRPSKYWCQLRRSGDFVFNRKMLVTGVRHRMQPTRWTCRLTLDPSSVFYETGTRWDEGRWGHGEWGRSR